MTSNLSRHHRHSFFPLREFDQQLGFFFGPFAGFCSVHAVLAPRIETCSSCDGDSGATKAPSSILYFGTTIAQFWSAVYSCDSVCCGAAPSLVCFFPAQSSPSLPPFCFSRSRVAIGIARRQPRCRSPARRLRPGRGAPAQSQSGAAFTPSDRRGRFRRALRGFQRESKTARSRRPAGRWLRRSRRGPDELV